MKYLPFFLFAILSFAGHAQTIAELDKKNGLDHFQFGSSVPSYQNQIKQLPDSAVALFLAGNVYTVTDTSLMKVFNYNATSITLYFSKNMLCSIDADLECSANIGMYDLILRDLITLFGEPMNDELSELAGDDLPLTRRKWSGAATSLYIMEVPNKNKTCYFTRIRLDRTL